MAYKLDLNKLIKDVRGPKGMAAVTAEVTKLKAELNRIRAGVEPQVEVRLKKAQKTLSEMMTKIEGRQKSLEKEIKETLTTVKTQGSRG